MTAAVFGFDYETHLIREDQLNPHPVCGSTYDEGDGVTRVWRAEGCAAQVLAAWERGQVAVGHNVAFDLGVTWRCLVDRLGVSKHDAYALIFAALRNRLVRDTMIRECLLQTAERGEVVDTTLGSCARRWLGVDLSAEKKSPTSWRLRYDELDPDNLSEWPDAALAYAGEDAKYAVRIYRAQGARVRVAGAHPYVNGDGSIPDEIPQVAWAFALHLLSSMGVGIDADRARRRLTEVDEALDILRGPLVSCGLLRAGGSVDKKRLAALVTTAYEGAGLAVPRNDVTAAARAKGATLGSVKTDADTIAEAPEGPDTFDLDTYREYAKLDKIRGTYLLPMSENRAGFLKLGYVPLKATGRTSCRAPNYQNPPQKGGVRECYAALPHLPLILDVDYSSLEIRTLAQVFLDLGWDDSETVRRLKDDPDYDPHANLAAQLLHDADVVRGCTYENVREFLADRSHPHHKAAKSKRSAAKPANFGFPGGMGALTFIAYARGYGMHFSLDEARHLKDAWLRLDPAHPRYLRLASDLTEGGGKAVVRQHRSGRIRGNIGYTQAANTRFQGLAADGAKRAVWAVAESCFTGTPEVDLYGCEPYGFVHDQIQVRAPRDHEKASKALDALCRVMILSMQAVVPDIEIRVSAALSDGRWYKDAASVRDPQTGLWSIYSEAERAIDPKELAK